MKIGPFTFARTKQIKALQRKRAQLARKAALQVVTSVAGSRGWWPLVRDFTTGAWQRNETIDVPTVLSNPTLYAIVTLMAGDIAKLRPMLVEQDENGIWSEVLTGSPFKQPLARPNSYQEWVDFAEWYHISKFVHGNAYALKARDERGMVRAMYVLDPYCVTPMVSTGGDVFYQLSEDPLNNLFEGVTAPASEIIHDVMCPLFHPLCGVSPIYAAGFPAVQGLNIRGQSDSFFKNGSRPGGILLVPGTIQQPKADEMKAEWKKSFGGDNQGDIAILSGGMTYQAMSVNAVDAQLIEQLHMTDEDICKPYHMPRHKVQVGPEPTVIKPEADNGQYYTDCLQKHIIKFQTKITRGLEMDNVPGKTLAMELDLDDLLMMDTETKADVSSKAVTGGLSYNEARLKFWDVGPVKGGDVPLAQQQNFSLEALAKRDASDDPFGTASRTVPAPQPTQDDTAINVKAFRAALVESRKWLAA